MSIFPLYKTPPMRPASIKLLAILGLLVAVLVVAAISQTSDGMVPAAEAGEAESASVRMSTDLPQKSWSDEWDEVHKAIIDRVVDEIQGF